MPDRTTDILDRIADLPEGVAPAGNVPQDLQDVFEVYDEETDPDMDDFPGDFEDAMKTWSALETSEYDESVEFGSSLDELDAYLDDDEEDDSYDQDNDADTDMSVSGAGSARELLDRHFPGNGGARDLLERHYPEFQASEVSEGQGSSESSREMDFSSSSNAEFEGASSHDDQGQFADVLALGNEMQQEGRRSGQRRYVKAYERLVGKKSPLSALRKPGSSCSVNMSSNLSFDAISMALTAGAFGIPVPVNLLARLGPEITLQVTGTISAGDDTKIRAALKLSLAGSFSASIAEKLGLNASLSAGVSMSMVGGYDDIEHFAAHYLRDVTGLITVAIGYKAYKFLKRRYRKSRGSYRIKSNDPQYLQIRELERRRRTRVKAVGLNGRADVSALKGLFGAGAEVAVTGKRFTRRRAPDAGNGFEPGTRKLHEKKHGYVAEGSANMKAGPLGGKVSMAFIHNDANPDNDGVYITATLSGDATAAASLRAAPPEVLDGVKFSVGGAMQLLSGTLSTTIENVSLPVPGIVANIDASTHVTLVWYQSGRVKDLPKGRSMLLPELKPFHLLYVRTSQGLGATLGVDGLPLYGGLAAGVSAGGGVTRVMHERVGHSSIAYVQALYLGMRAHQRDDWGAWVQKHDSDLRAMQRSGNFRKELRELAVELETEEVREELFQEDRFDDWLHEVEGLFQREAGRRSASPGWTAYKTLGDRRRGLR